jgi:hypothetical protein
MGSIDGKYIRWQVKINLFEVALAEIQMLLQQVGRIYIFVFKKRPMLK